VIDANTSLHLHEELCCCWCKHPYYIPPSGYISVLLLSPFFFFCSTGVWTQGLRLEPLHPPALYFLCVMGFYEMGVSWTICLGWLQTTIILISASWVSRITGVSHWSLPCCTL
jgi:hypothetical protein